MPIGPKKVYEEEDKTRQFFIYLFMYLFFCIFLINKQMILFTDSENEELTDEMVDGKDLNSDNMAKTLFLWLSQLRELRKEIGQLRENVCNKYAENMGDNIDCAMQ